MAEAALTIRVRYSCPECGLDQVACDVPARGAEDVLVWMEQTFRHVAAHHNQRSPQCHPQTLKDLAIPVHGTDRIGGPQVQ